MNKVNLYLKGLAGYILDIYRIVKLDLTNPHSYTKFQIINTIRKKTGSTVFIEVGTYLGVAAGRCSSVFDTVYTIELSSDLAKQASSYLADEGNVKVIEGDGLEVLPDLLQDEKINDVLVFLDGHFSGGVTACGAIPEPAVEELQILSKYRQKIRAIIIDDFRCFGTELGFPEKSVLLRTAEEHFGNNSFEITVQMDQLIISRKT